MKGTKKEGTKRLASVPKLGAVVVTALALSATVAGKATAAPNAPADTRVDDAQIVQRVRSFERGEVQAADAVKGKFSSPMFWQFAQRMSADHASLEQKFRTLTAESRQSGETRRGADLDLQKLTATICGAS